MPVKTYKMGPGTLTLGTGPLDVTCQVSKLQLETTENVQSTDPIPLLCDDDLETDDVVSLDHELVGTLVQDLTTGGVVAWTWANAKTWQPFTFIPNNNLGAELTGEIRPIPMTIGGDVKTNPTAEIKWACRTPVPAWATGPA